MKKTINKLAIIFVLAIILIPVANAQFYYGVKGGYLSSKLTGNDTYGGMNYSGKPSLGLTFGVKLATDLNLQWEVLYSVKGTNQKFIHKDYISGIKNDTIPTFKTVTKQYDNNLSLSYIEIPVFIKKSFSFRGGVFPYDRSIGKVDFDIFVGPYVGYLMSASADLNATRQATSEISGKINIGETTDTISKFFMGQGRSASVIDDETIPESTILSLFEDSEPQISELNSIDIGISGGIGLSIEVSSLSKLTFSAKGSMGLLSIDKAYFNNISYALVESTQDDPTTAPNTVELNGTYYDYSKTTTKADLKNMSIGLYVGFIHYIGVPR